jgi:signal transduction histidine kinase
VACGRQAYIYAGLALAAAAGALLGVPGAQPSPDPAYALVGAGLVVGALLAVRLRPGEPGTPLLLIPALLAEARFGSAALPAVAYASLVGALVRRTRGVALAVAAAHATLAYAFGHLASQVADLDLVGRSVVFAVAFAGALFVLDRLASMVGGARLRDARLERPDVLVLLALAPLAGLPLVAAARLGDGGLVLGLAAVLALLALVAEARNLATARVEAQAERDTLARANALQRDLIHLITHELKNPLTAVLVYTQLMERALREERPERLPDYIGRVQQGGRTLQRLVDNLLQLSRLEDTADLPPAQPVDVAVLASEVATELEPLADQKRQRLWVEIPTELPSVEASPDLLREALSNLVSNAVKYTPEGGEVRVWARPLTERHEVALGVSDTGIGLSQQDLSRLFSKFFRSADPRARAQPGSGLGLALTQVIISRMGARIEVDSRLNEGTTFRILLPEAR